MPALLTATVLHWRAEVIGGQEVVTLAKDPRRVELYVEDGAADADFSPIIAEYIRTEPGAVPGELLKDARDGLLQVVRFESTPVTRPAVPLTRRAQLLRDDQAQGLAALGKLVGKDQTPPAGPNNPAAPKKPGGGSKN